MQRISFFDQISKNKRNSLLLAMVVSGTLFLLLYIIGELFAPGYSLIIFFISLLVVFAYSWSTYTYGDKIVLSSVHAKPVDPSDPKYVHLVNVVEGLSLAAGIPKPKIYVMESDEINAFATGRDPKHASVCFTTGALKYLNREELEGVAAHEISHIRNYDIRFATVVAVMVGLVAIVSHMFLRSFRFGGRKRESSLLLLIGLILAIFAPIATRLVQAAISRQREFLADASAVQLTRYPLGLAHALEKIKNINKGKMKVNEAVSHLFFTDPNKSPLDRLFATHPPIDERIRILKSM